MSSANFDRLTKANFHHKSCLLEAVEGPQPKTTFCLAKHFSVSPIHLLLLPSASSSIPGSALTQLKQPNDWPTVSC